MGRPTSYGGIIDIERGWQQQKFTDEIYILDISKCVNESTTDINGFNNVKIVDSEGEIQEIKVINLLKVVLDNLKLVLMLLKNLLMVRQF